MFFPESLFSSSLSKYVVYKSFFPLQVFMLISSDVAPYVSIIFHISIKLIVKAILGHNPFSNVVQGLVCLHIQQMIVIFRFECNKKGYRRISLQ